MTTLPTPRTPSVRVPSIGTIRDRLGRAHYERMRVGMLPTLGRLPSWGQLTEAGREVHRRRTEWLVDAVAELLVYGSDPEQVTRCHPCCGAPASHPHKGLCPAVTPSRLPFGGVLS